MYGGRVASSILAGSIKESKMFYKQCKLIKKTDKGMIQDVRWIPEKYAKRNSVLELHIDGEWNDGWKVMSVGNRMEDKMNTQKNITTAQQNAIGVVTESLSSSYSSLLLSSLCL